MGHKKSASSGQPRTPSHLYLKGRIYYYRYRFPKSLTARGWLSEIRVCLRTAYKKVAARIAFYLHVATTITMEKWEMSEACNAAYPNEQTAQLDAFLKAEVRRIIEQGPKQPINLKEIDKRLNSYMAQILELESQSMGFPLAVEERSLVSANLSPSDIWKKSAEDIQKDLNSGKKHDEYCEEAVLTAISENIVKENELSDANIEMFIKRFMVMQIKLNQILAARYNGDYTLEQQLCPQIADNASHIQDVTKQSQESQQVMMLSELIEKYIDTNIADGKWKKQTVADHKNRITSLQVIICDKIITEYSRTDIRNFRDTLLKLPVNWRKEINNNKISLDSLVDSSQKTLSVKTVNTNVEAVSSMFSWAVNEGYLSSNPAKGLSLKDEQPDIDKRQAFTQEDIRNLFFSGDYSQNRFSKPSYYWVPLISLYTGMRLEEICQLHCEDIYEEDGLYVIDIKPDSKDGLNDKLIKTKNAVRKIPIHNKLLELGFIQYRANLVKNGEIRLFPELNKTEKSPKYGKQVGKQFSAWVKKKGISGSKTFHSLRHTFSDFFKKRNLHTDMFRQVFGHENRDLAARQYGSRFTPKEIYDQLISLINFGEHKA